MILFNILISYSILVVAITIHEFAHAYMADRLGDPTARIAGRLTFNPIAHLDPVGTVLLPLFMLLSGTGMLFGWAKPTPFDPFNLRDPKRDSALIAFAGPLSNLFLAFICSIIIRLFFSLGYLHIGLLGYLLIDILSALVNINVVLAVFNLIPVHPLDGFAVVGGLLPKKYYQDWMHLSSYGVFFLILLIFPFFGASPISTLISPVVNLLLSILLPGKMGGII